MSKFQCYSKKTWAVIFVVSLCILALFSVGVSPIKAAPKTIVVPDDYPTIQAAVKQAEAGDTVYVKSGNYNGGIALSTPITLVGENCATTTIIGGVTLEELSNSSTYGRGRVSLLNFILPTTYGIYINSSDVTVSGFTIQGSRVDVYVAADGAQVKGNVLGTCDIYGDHNSIINNTAQYHFDVDGFFNLIKQNFGSLSLTGSNNTITGNVFDGAAYLVAGLIMENANFNLIKNNTISNTNEGMIIGHYGHNSSYNMFAGNKIENSVLWSILMGAGSYNVFYGNMVTNTGGAGHDGYALALGGNRLVAEKNLFFGNIFVNNTKNFGVNWEVTGANSFDDGKTGNYWDDYRTKYASAGESGNSGTGNTPYILTSNNQDNHPLINQPSISDDVPALPAPWSILSVFYSTSEDTTLTPSPSSAAPAQSTSSSPLPTTPEFPVWSVPIVLFAIIIVTLALVLRRQKPESA